MAKPRVAIVSTSIGSEPPAYLEWGKQGDLIVAGDINSPPELGPFITSQCGLFLSPADQSDTPGSVHIGWKNIQRRNAALWYALTATPRYDYIALVDDDNYPSSDWVNGAINNLETHTGNVMTSRSGFLNTGKLCIPQFNQRGNPRGVDASPYVITVADGSHVHPVVFQSQVLGDPDCDAVQRIASPVDVKQVITEGVVQPGVFAAFNSQATLWAADFAPVAAMFPGIGRYDDIMASWLFHRLAREYNVALFVGTPVVTQDRNEHDLSKDLANELWGMDRAFDIIATLRAAHISSDTSVVQSYGELITAIAPALPATTGSFALAWFRAWRDEL